jgi:hypothetical protein
VDLPARGKRVGDDPAAGRGMRAGFAKDPPGIGRSLLQALVLAIEAVPDVCRSPPPRPVAFEDPVRDDQEVDQRGLQPGPCVEDDPGQRDRRAR